MRKVGNKIKTDSPHGNAHTNMDPHHLYEIWDDQEQEVFKYGISKEPIDADGSSSRLRKQVGFLNIIAGFIRYIGRIIMTGIEGKEKAERIEDEYTDAFEQKYGRLPKGNITRNRKR
jgi:hypothetical protein